MSRIENFSQMVEHIAALPPGARRSCLAIECDRIAQFFKHLVLELQAAAKSAAPVKAAQPTRKAIKCRRN